MIQRIKVPTVPAIINGEVTKLNIYELHQVLLDIMKGNIDRNDVLLKVYNEEYNTWSKGYYRIIKENGQLTEKVFGGKSISDYNYDLQKLNYKRDKEQIMQKE
jgi:hypothetical protein